MGGDRGAVTGEPGTRVGRSARRAASAAGQGEKHPAALCAADADTGRTGVHRADDQSAYSLQRAEPWKCHPVPESGCQPRPAEADFTAVAALYGGRARTPREGADAAGRAATSNGGHRGCGCYAGRGMPGRPHRPRRRGRRAAGATGPAQGHRSRLGRPEHGCSARAWRGPTPGLRTPPGAWRFVDRPARRPPPAARRSAFGGAYEPSGAAVTPAYGGVDVLSGVRDRSGLFGSESVKIGQGRPDLVSASWWNRGRPVRTVSRLRPCPGRYAPRRRLPGSHSGCP